GDESLQAQDEMPCEGERVQKQSDQVLMHEGTHQLQHEYSGISLNAPLNDGDKNVPARKAMWFEEGLAEFMGACEVDKAKAEYLEGATWYHNRILLDRVDGARRDAT